MQIFNDPTYLTKNFKFSEFFTKSKDFEQSESHYLDDRLIQAVQWLRDLTGRRIKINSSYRTLKHNTLIGGASNSYHMKGMAVDFAFMANDNKEMITKLKNAYNDPEDKLKSSLTDMGINGIIFYDTFIHIDTREKPYVSDRSTRGNVMGIVLLLAMYFILG